MREVNTCPICGGRAGRVEDRVHDGERVLVYWHTDLPDQQEYCIECSNGCGKQVFQGDGSPTGPRA